MASVLGENAARVIKKFSVKQRRIIPVKPLQYLAHQRLANEA